MQKIQLVNNKFVQNYQDTKIFIVDEQNMGKIIQIDLEQFQNIQNSKNSEIEYDTENNQEYDYMLDSPNRFQHQMIGSDTDNLNNWNGNNGLFNDQEPQLQVHINESH